MVEYALLVGLIAVVAVVAVGLLGGGIAGLFSHGATASAASTRPRTATRFPKGIFPLPSRDDRAGPAFAGPARCR